MSRKKNSRILENFLLEMEKSNKSHNTIVNYRSDIVHFLENCSQGINDITVETLRQHLGGLNSKSSTTKARHMSSLKTFLNWCYRKDYINSNPIFKINDDEKPKIESTPVNINKNSVEKVICSIEIFSHAGSVNINNLKYRLLFTLMYEAGLKVSETLNLKFEDINTETETIFVNSGLKRRIPLHSAESIKLLRLFTDELKITSGLIFKGGDDTQKPLSYQSVNRFWRKCLLNQHIEIKLQQLRDCYALDLLKRGFNINIVSKLLGHKNIQTSIKYLHH